MENANTRKWLVPTIILVLLVAVIGGLIWSQNVKQKATGKNIKLGIVTILSGPVAYEGESTMVGVKLAQEDLAKQGYNVEVITEDYQLDSAKALTAAKKLVEIDQVDGLYAEFNPATYSITPYLKGLQNDNTLFVYLAAPTSPLKELPNAYKTYFDYSTGCRDLAQKYKDQGIKKIGVLKVNMEFGEICNEAVKGVYGENMVMEAYDAGAKDFNTQILKMKKAGVEGIINVAFANDTLTALKAMKDNNFVVPYGTETDGVDKSTKEAYPEMIAGITTFGYTDLDPDFVARVKKAAGNKELATDYAAAEAYIQIQNMVKAIDGSNGDIKTITEKMAKSPAQKLLGFGGYDKNRSSILKIDIGPVK